MKKLYLRIFFTIMAIGIAFPLQAQNWTMTGNNATTSHFLGTKNENPLTFKTNNTTTMTLTCGGRVGIGTASPNSLLHIHQMDRPDCVTAPGGGGGHTITGITIPSSSILLTNILTGPSLLRGFKIDLSSYNVSLKNWENGKIELFSAANSGITISPGGKVTIGGASSYNANSLYQLFVDGSMNVSGTLYASDIEGDVSVNGKLSSTGLAITHTSGTDWGYGMNIGVNRSLTKAIAVTHTASGEVFRVMGNGTTYAKYLVSNQIKVSLSAGNIFEWPDYVFSPDYRLMPLKEVEWFVKTNRHLPEIPSKQEVLENGLDVAEMNALLLKKVEELTLYIIELEKRIAEIEKKGGER